MNQRVIRFDARLDKDDYVKKLWDSEHRDCFLLKPDIEWPLSVDPMAWPSVFYSVIFREATNFPYGSIEVDPSVDGGQYWLNLDQMTQYYDAHRKGGSRGVFIGIDLFSEQSLGGDTVPYEGPKGVQCALTLGRAVPSDRPATSELLGYDVADGSWISGLCNCEYSREEKEQLTPVWVPRLNNFGLIASLDHATDFKRLSDARVPEHSPFWVYAIWRTPLRR